MRRKNIDYRDIIFNRCDWCKDNQLLDERIFENYMRLTMLINKWDCEGVSREYIEDI